MVRVLIGENEKHLVDENKKELNTASGVVKLNKKSGMVKSHIGKKFVVVEPSMIDFLEKLKRGAQVILPKDLGIIVAYTGLRPNWKILDAGTGSGFSALFLANLVPKGKVYSYEKEKRFYKIAKENAKKVGIKNLVLKNKDVFEVKEKGFDLIVLDFKDSVKFLEKAAKILKPGGWIVVYSPTVDELLKVQKKIKKLCLVEKKIVEVLVREWQYEKTLRPKTKGIVHTGFISFGRKFC